MSPVWIIVILAFISGVSMMAVSALGIIITFFQILLSLFVLAIVFVGFVVYYFLRDRGGDINQRDYITEGVTYAIKWAKKEKNLELEFLDDGDATTRSYAPDPQIFVGMRLTRSYSDPESPGMPVTMVVQVSPLAMRDYHDYPSSELLKDPFVFFAAGFSGSPTPKALPDKDAAFYSRPHYPYGPNINIGQPSVNSMKSFFERSSEREGEED